MHCLLDSSMHIAPPKNITFRRLITWEVLPMFLLLLTLAKNNASEKPLFKFVDMGFHFNHAPKSNHSGLSQT